MKIILLNGPPRSGKDSAALAIEDFCIERGLGIAHDKMSLPNKAAFAGMMGLSIEDDFRVEPWEGKKEEIIPKLGTSYRQWQIDFSERFMKPAYGEDIFARLLIDRIDFYGDPKYSIEVAVISDCGFQIEVDTLLKDGRYDPLLIRCHRPGFTFEGDSRQYVNLRNIEGSRALDLHNNGGIPEWNVLVVHAVASWLNLPTDVGMAEGGS